MIAFKGVALVIFSTSLLAFPLFSLLLGEQPASSQDEPTGTVEQPTKVSTKVRYCNGTSQAINAAIGFKPDFTAWNWRTLNPGDCSTITWKKYSGRVDFFIDVNSLGINGNRPAFRKPVSAGNHCYQYVQNGNQLMLKPEKCPSLVDL